MPRHSQRDGPTILHALGERRKGGYGVSLLHSSNMLEIWR